MKTIRQGVRENDLEKDTYGRYICTACGARVTRLERQGDAGQVHQCPDCGREWQRLR